MAIEIEVDGVRYENLLEAHVNTSMDTLASSFSIHLTSDADNPIPFFGNSPCRIFVDGSLALTGNIEVIEIAGGPESHDIEIAGRSRTGDILDSYLAAIVDFNAPITLQSLCTKIIAHLGIGPQEGKDAYITVIDPISVLSSPVVTAAPTGGVPSAPTQVIPLTPLEPLVDYNAAEDQLITEVGEGAYDFLNKWARKRQVLLATTPSGDLLLSRPQANQTSGRRNFLHHRKGDAQNNVIEYSATFDETGRYNSYIVASQGNTTLATSNTGMIINDNSIVDQSGQAVLDGSIRLGRQFVVMAETAASEAENVKRARWEANVRKVRGRTYSCTVAGHRNQTGELWSAGELVFVNDEFAGISSDMRINDVEFIMSAAGHTTELLLLEKNAYTLSLDAPGENVMGQGVIDPEPPTFWPDFNLRGDETESPAAKTLRILREAQ